MYCNETQYLKNRKKAIEDHLDDPSNPVKAHQLFKKRRPPYIQEQKQYAYSKIIRKTLECTNDILNKTQPKLNSTGLYHDRKDDAYDIHHVDCVEDGFCLHHSRANDTTCNYKHHYHCRYGMCSHPYKNPDMFHGERKWFSSKFVCFQCRNVTSRSSSNKNLTILEKWPRCSNCQKHMTSVSVQFQPPPKTDIKHWEKLDKEWYADSRITYDEYVNGL